MDVVLGLLSFAGILIGLGEGVCKAELAEAHYKKQAASKAANETHTAVVFARRSSLQRHSIRPFAGVAWMPT
jgi:hypothetical protein